MRGASVVLVAVVGGLGFTTPALAEKAPRWLLEAVADAPAAATAEARVLFREREIEYSADGSYVERERWVLRIERSDGQQHALARAMYRTDTGEVRSLEAWVLRDGGEATHLGKDRTLDIAYLAEGLYNEVRVRALDARPEVAPGSVVGFECVSEDRTLFHQFTWSYGEELPVVRSRLAIRVPKDWTVEARGFPDEVPSTADAASGLRSWEVRDVPALTGEPHAPAPGRSARWVGFTCRGPEGPAGEAAFADWDAVSRWASSALASGGETPPSIHARAQALVAGASTRLDSLRAIASFVQGVRYASISLGLGSGGGYRPRPPETVLQTMYGDCKDKAALLRSMLGSVAISCGYVLVRSRDSTAVRPEWISPQQFDHCIVAIPTSPGAVPGAREDGLLLFDPTDPYTPLGDLPLSDQGGFGLLVDTPGSTFFRLPSPARERSRLTRSLRLEVLAGGDARGELLVGGSGASAQALRPWARSAPGSAAQRDGLSAFVSGNPPPRLVELGVLDDRPVDGLSLSCRVEGLRVARPAGADRWIFRLAHLPVVGLPEPERSRASALQLAPLALEDSVRFRIPPGLRIDELPPPVRIEGPVATYTAECRKEGQDVAWSRQVRIVADVLPATRYAELLTFLESVRAAEQSAIVVAGR